MAKSYTLRDLQLLARGNVPQEISLALTFASSTEDILAQVDIAIDHVAQEFARTPKERRDRSEDGLSIDLITSLKDMGFQASHDATTGGHPDIVIDGIYDFLWLGEAKIHKSYDWLLQGFNQLDSRYATASKNQDHGGMVIYCLGERVDQVMDRWKEHLTKERPDVTVEEREAGELELKSSHVHKRTGRLYRVRHVPISLYWKPIGKNGS
jgi:hypothetical protein